MSHSRTRRGCREHSPQDQRPRAGAVQESRPVTARLRKVAFVTRPRLLLLVRVSERLLRGEFADPATWPGMLFYAVLFLIAALLASRTLRLGVNHLIQRHVDEYIDITSITFF